MMSSGSAHQILIRFSGNTPQVSGKVLPEAQDIPRHGSGDPLKDRFGHMIECDRFDVQKPLDKAKWTSQGPGVRAGAQWYFTMTRRAPFTPFVKLSS